jgi:TolB-like protein/Tfp pilus assembly protein PilF
MKLAAIAAISFLLFHYRRPLTALGLAVPEKSIAVLPFENLSEEKQNAYFADGMQDEILTDLAKIADLKVISRASVMQYKSGITRNLRQIGQELGVANVLEGTVQRPGDRVRVSAQLLDARNDVHLWAEHYDRPLDDVFAIQSEIAKAIADQLRARLSPSVKAAIERPPTADLAAFDLYTRAKTLTLQLSYRGGQAKDSFLQAVELLNQAVTRDPNFLLAYCQLAYAHDILYLANLDHTPARRASADAAVQTALRLQPDSGEAHLALAQHLYAGYLDYDCAKQELAIARPMLPNSSQAFQLIGFIHRRQARWDESARDMEKAIEFDPRNLFIFQQLSISYWFLHRYEQMATVLDRNLAVAPKDVPTRTARAQVDLEWSADTKPLHSVIESILAEDPAAAPLLANAWLHLALSEHNLAAADRALVALSGNSYTPSTPVLLKPAFVEGLVARIRGDTATAHIAFTKARAQQEEIVRSDPDYAPAICVLGLTDAMLGRKEDALREGRRAVELLPVARDTFYGPEMVRFFAVICAWTGEKELALQQLTTVTQVPSFVTYGQLRLHPLWDPCAVIRASRKSSPRFREKRRALPSKMPGEVQKEIPLEIAHVLLIDLVGYSKLLVNEQIELLQELNQIVRSTECFRTADKTGKLIRVPTGDGMALLFFHSPEEPVRCALETSKALQDHPHIHMRMGVHSGPVNRVIDVNDETNMAGAGINVAQRVLDCGMPGIFFCPAMWRKI